MKGTLIRFLLAITVILMAGTTVALGVDNELKYDLYGVAHVSLDLLDDGQESSLYLSSNSSRIGLKGTSDINEKLKTIWQVECDASLDESGGQFASRNSFVGVSSEYGAVFGGRHDTAFEVLSDKLALFRDQLGDARNIIGNQGAGWNRRNNDVLAYQSPHAHPFQVFALYAPEESDPETEVMSFSGAYKAKCLFLILAVEQHGAGLTTGSESEMGFRAGGSFTRSQFKITGMYEQLNDVDGVSDVSASAWGLGGAFTKDKHVFKAQYYSTEGLDSVDDDGASMIAVGYDHHLADNTKLYLAWAMTTNDAAANASMSSAGRGNGVTPLAGDDPSGFSLGMVYGF